MIRVNSNPLHPALVKAKRDTRLEAKCQEREVVKRSLLASFCFLNAQGLDASVCSVASMAITFTLSMLFSSGRKGTCFHILYIIHVYIVCVM